MICCGYPIITLKQVGTNNNQYLYIMKLIDIISERTESRTKENFLLLMKQLFPYRNGSLYDFGNQENFTKNSTVNVHCKKHNVDFPALVEYLLKGRIGPNGCGECKKDDSHFLIF